MSNSIRPKAKDAQTDKTLIAQIFYDIFNDARLKKLADEDLNLQINYNVNMHGNVIDISFVFADNTSLKPIEIENLEGRLIKSVKFKLNQKVYEGNTYIPLHNFVNFKRLINHTSDAVQ